MVAFRILAWILVAVGIGLFGADAVSSLETGEPMLRSTAMVLSLFGIDGAALVENSPSGVSQVVDTIMGLPLWGVIGIIGVVMTLIFRPME